MKYILADKGFYDEKIFSRLTKEKVYFVIPAKRYKSIINALFGLSPSDKDELVFGDNIAETGYTPTNSKTKLRLLFKFCPKEETGKDRVFEFLTNSPRDEASDPKLQVLQGYSGLAT